MLIATDSDTIAIRFLNSATYNFLHGLHVADQFTPENLMPSSTTSNPIPLIGVIEAQQAALKLSDHDLCGALGFEREIVWGLIKAGSMKLPLSKIPALAAALGLDAAALLKQALDESDPVLSKLIDETFNPMHLTATEVAQIKHQRKLCGNAPGVPIVFEGKDVSALVAVSA